MPHGSRLTRAGRQPDILATGLCIGFVGGLAEIGVVWLYATSTGGDAGGIAQAVAAAIGLPDAPPAAGLIAHMLLAGMLGMVLSAVLRAVVGRPAPNAVVVPFMLGSLAVVWALIFSMVLPALCPDFVHLLPYPVTLASMLAFGLAAAIALRAIDPPALPQFHYRTPGRIRVGGIVRHQ